MRLSEVTIRALKPRRKVRNLSRRDFAGFGVRISQGGTKTFTLMYGAKRTRPRSRRYPIISLQEARGEARRLLAERTLGSTGQRRLTFDKAKEHFLDLQTAQQAADAVRYSVC